ncbi:MAG: cydB [Nitrospira sp.]|jgi:cytochrome d ubiquinol oxidase subunit II|nr:cydB [Nitrospira sp.]
METFWYGAVTLMLAVYVVLDGYDFGVGIVYPFVARTEEERRMALAAIGPVWSGNEVWLIAAGAVLFLAFPKAYAAGFSGFYLALIIVLWLLMGRGLAIELRTHIDHPVWRQFWDVVFAGASALLAIVFGAALGNLIRGVPLNAEGYFFVALWTDFLPGPEPGILDWFTIMLALTSVVLLTSHGGSFLAMKTTGELRARARRVARLSVYGTAPLVVLVLAALSVVQPSFRLNYDAYPVGYGLPLMGLAALAALLVFRTRERDAAAFAASSLLLLSLLAGTAWGSYPNILIATTDPSLSLTITNASAGKYGLQAAFWWFIIGLTTVMIYQVWIHRLFWGPVKTDSSDLPAH